MNVQVCSVLHDDLQEKDSFLDCGSPDDPERTFSAFWLCRTLSASCGSLFHNKAQAQRAAHFLLRAERSRTQTCNFLQCVGGHIKLCSTYSILQISIDIRRRRNSLRAISTFGLAEGRLILPVIGKRCFPHSSYCRTGSGDATAIAHPQDPCFTSWRSKEPVMMRYVSGVLGIFSLLFVVHFSTEALAQASPTGGVAWCAFQIPGEFFRKFAFSSDESAVFTAKIRIQENGFIPNAGQVSTIPSPTRPSVSLRASNMHDSRSCRSDPFTDLRRLPEIRHLQARSFL